MPAEGLALCWETLASGEHVAGQWYSWTTMKRWCPWHGMYGSMEAEYEVQRTIKRAELTAFLCLFRKVCGPIQVHVDNKATIDGLRKGDLLMKIWEEVDELVKKGILVEVAHVKAHRTKKEKEKVTQFQRFVTDGNEKADELAKAGAMMDEGFVGEEVCKCGQLPLFGEGMERL